MLRATFNSKYRKASGWVLTYAVIGTDAELTEYVAVMSARANKTPDQWQRTQAGNPIFFVQETQLMRNGQLAAPSYDLVKSFDGMNYYTDTTKQDLARNQRIIAKQEDAEAQLLAELRLGIRTIGAPAARITAATPTAAPEIAPSATSDPMAETIKLGLGETGDADAELVGEGAGTEKL